MGQKKGRQVRKDRRQWAGKTRTQRGERRSPSLQTRLGGTREGDWGRGDWRLWRPPRGRMRSSPARYKEWAPHPCPRVPGGGGDSCLSAAVWGGPAPPRASLCKAPAPARSASARGAGRRSGVGEASGPPPITDSSGLGPDCGWPRPSRIPSLQPSLHPAGLGN